MRVEVGCGAVRQPRCAAVALALRRGGACIDDRGSVSRQCDANEGRKKKQQRYERDHVALAGTRSVR